MQDTISIEIDWNGSLYDPASSEFVARLESKLESANSNTIILLRSKDACHDYHRDWLDSITSKLYWEDLVAHFQRVHLLFLGICLSKAKWYFISSHDCLGSWWDLALACQGRVWANPYAKVGFPEVYIDMLPPLANGALRRFDAYKSLDDVRKNAILHSKDAFTLGLISLVLQGQNWADAKGIESLYAWIKKSQTINNLRSTTRRELIEETPDLLGVVEDRSTLSLRRKQIALSHLETGHNALRERNIGARALTMSQIRAGCAARVLFEDYRSWLSRRISRYEIGSKDRWWTASVGSGTLAVDLSRGIPPQSVIYTLLARKIRLLLMAPSEEQLREYLETILSRSQKVGLSRKDLLTSWRGRLDWFVGHANSVSSLWLACSVNDFLEFGVGSTRLMTRYRLSGNFGQANLGWCEAIEHLEPAQEASENTVTYANELADILTNGVLRQQGWKHPIPLSVALRFALLAEMVVLSETGAWPDVVEQCKLLANAGWGFAGDVPQWDSLLRHFGKSPSVEAALKDLGLHDSQSLKVSSIAELRQRAPKTGQVSRFEISAARLSRHFEAFAVQVGERILSLGIVEGTSMADLYVTLAWGYPGKSLVPSELVGAMGDGRIAHWLGRDIRR